MDPSDKYIEAAEEDAGSPSRHEKTEYEKAESNEPIARLSTASSSSSSSSDSSVAERDADMSRAPTQRDDIGNLERHATAMSRIQTQRSQHSGTVGATLKSRQSRKPLPNFGAGKAYPPPLPAREEYVVEFDGVDDPLHAQNWPLRKKIFMAAMLGFTTMTSAFGSSIFSAATRVVAHQFGVGITVGVLGTSFYVLGFATGPVFWAPLSELKGRRLPLVVASFGFAIFNVGVAAGKDLQTVLICRFFAGFFGACPLTVSCHSHYEPPKFCRSDHSSRSLELLFLDWIDTESCASVLPPSSPICSTIAPEAWRLPSSHSLSLPVHSLLPLLVGLSPCPTSAGAGLNGSSPLWASLHSS